MEEILVKRKTPSRRIGRWEQVVATHDNGYFCKNLGMSFCGNRNREKYIQRNYQSRCAGKEIISVGCKNTDRDAIVLENRGFPTGWNFFIL